ncbi:MAG: LLM class flavin-dependent oxidoreductase [Armatimonadetes bacterium]|nr:MAG: LLM class flavin-dependent oxidoreductase [Armatimonadota bacterium]
MRPLRVGVQLPEVERFVPWPEYRDMAIAAEAVGFDSIWVGDHLLYRQPDGPTGPWEAWSMLAALAAVTERVQLGPLVAATSFHNPAMLAKKAATVDEISNGRLILGLGAGWNRTEYDAYGFPFDRRASRFEEAFTIIRALLTVGEIDFDGEFYQLSDCVLAPPARSEGIPLMIGSEGPRVLAAALPHVQLWNGWHAWYGNTAEGAAGLNAKVDVACAGVGVDPADIERTVTVLVGAPGGSNRQLGSPNRATSHPMTGSRDEVAAALRGFADVGIDRVQLVVDPITVGSIEWLGGVLDLLDS